MSLIKEITKCKSIFIDTAPFIYFIEAHPKFGPLVKEIFKNLRDDKFIAYTSVLTITEVLPKPVQMGKEELVNEFLQFLRQGKNIYLVEINSVIAEKAGRLRGKYLSIKTIDAIQLAVALSVDAGVFLSNDENLKQVKEIKVLILKDYL
ncbi:MAG: PIN domain-containing protein [candidate division WOR-3 bacterium]